MEYVLEMKDICKSFPGVKVLENVNLQIKPGEVHALMGENGAGKSTLMKILMGIYKADKGSIVLQGQETVIHGPKDAMGKGISMIHQELNTLLDMEVAENVFVGREILKKGFSKMKIVDLDKMRDETARYFREMSIDIDPRAKMRTLSVAEMQLVEIVKAISLNSKIIVMDEPTSAITEKEAQVLFAQIDRLKKQGVAIIYISHKMDEIFRISDTITVLRDGQWIGTKPASELDDNSLIKMMVGRELTDIYPKEPAPIGDVILEVKDLSRGKKVKNVSLTLRRGEVLGIAGLVGAGRSELVETIFGLYPKTGGEIFLNGKKTDIKNPKEAIKNKIALITEDRKLTGLNLIASVKENISIVSLSKMSKNGIIDKKRENEVAEKYIKELKIKTPNGNAIVGNLSGGNQQKVVLAKWLLDEPEIIIFDEPTRGIDIGAKRDIYLLINELAKERKAVIVISSEMAEVMGISDRIVVMCEGELKGEVQRDEFSQELIMSYASNIEGRAG
ncbi:MAG: sugar ABC transporter ATP-binding protein [Oliverpabstia sp.]|nr:sugar ABC transporter ATP-binding protein [Lachnospiraceae bacterium]MDY5026401.1 sugar ABC transporter ATP-binding protein [Oliverpabstia sp.]